MVCFMGADKTSRVVEVGMGKKDLVTTLFQVRPRKVPLPHAYLLYETKRITMYRAYLPYFFTQPRYESIIG